MKGCQFYTEVPLLSGGLKKTNLTKAISQKEESGINSNDNVSMNGDTTNNDESVAPSKRRQRGKKDKQIDPKEDETEEKKKLKKKDHIKKLADSSIVTGISREQDTMGIDESMK
jgi:hypothetical protein